MKHRHKGRLLHREKGQREALIRSLARSIVLHHEIVTTEAKAKEVRPMLERLITKAKSGSLAHYRFVVEKIGKDAASKMKKELLPKIGARTSGFLRITKQGVRKSDASRMAQISFVD